ERMAGLLYLLEGFDARLGGDDLPFEFLDSLLAGLLLAGLLGELALELLANLLVAVELILQLVDDRQHVVTFIAERVRQSARYGAAGQRGGRGATKRTRPVDGRFGRVGAVRDRLAIVVCLATRARIAGFHRGSFVIGCEQADGTQS